MVYGLLLILFLSLWFCVSWAYSFIPCSNYSLYQTLCWFYMSISLSFLAPGLSLFLFTQQRKQVYKTWHIYSSQPLPSPDVEQSCQGKEALSVIFQTPLFISHSFDKLLTLSKIHSISMLERNDKSLEVRQQVDQRLSSDNSAILSGGNTSGLLPK